MCYWCIKSVWAKPSAQSSDAGLCFARVERQPPPCPAPESAEWAGSNTSLPWRAQQSLYWDSCRHLRTTIPIALVGPYTWSWICLMWPSTCTSPHLAAWFLAKSCFTPSSTRSQCHTLSHSKLVIRFVLQRICLERGCLQDRPLQNLSSRRISAWGIGTSGMHQRIPGTFSSGHPQERNKERTSIQPASQSFYIHPGCVESKFDWKAEPQNHRIILVGKDL